LNRAFFVSSQLYVLLDSNFLMLPSVKRINVLSELDRVLGRSYKLLTINHVVEELERLASLGRPSERRRAKLALMLMKEWNVEVVGVPLQAKVDDAIAEASSKRGWVVATNDRELRRRLKELGVPTVYLRGGKRLTLEGEVEALTSK